MIQAAENTGSNQAGSKPYLYLGFIYDWLMSHVDYPHWAGYLRSLQEKHCSNPPKTALEIAAGTGSLSSCDPLLPGCKLICTEKSHGMLTRAKPKMDHIRPQPGFTVTDALHLPFKSGFDVVYMTYDSFNYLLSPEQAIQVLKEVEDCLNPDGIFIFDITTEYNSIKYFEEDFCFEESENGAYARKSWYERKQKTQFNSFVMFIKGEDGRYQRHEEHHQQRIYSRSEIRQFADKAGLEVEVGYNGFSFSPANPNSERIHYVLRKS